MRSVVQSAQTLSPRENGRQQAECRRQQSCPAFRLSCFRSRRELMKHRNPTLLFLLLASASILFLVFNSPSLRSVTSQTRERRVNGNNTSASTNEDAGRMPALPA